MQNLTIVLNGSGAWPDLSEKQKSGKFIHLGAEADPQIACLQSGMTSGKPSVALRLTLPDGTVVLFETSLALLLTAADAFRTRYGDPRA